MNNKEAAEYIKAHCNPDMTQKTQWEIAIVMAVKALLSGQQKGNIEEDPTIDAVEVVRCNQCKHYEGVHGVPGNAPCAFWGIGGVMWDDFCKRGERWDG